MRLVFGRVAQTPGSSLPRCLATPNSLHRRCDMDKHMSSAQSLNHHHHHPRLNQVALFFFGAFFVEPLVGDIMADVAHAASAAKRRGERRLRTMLRHERRSVAMALVEFTHHSSRGQRTARAWRTRRTTLHGDRRFPWHGSLFDPGPQRSDRSLRRSAGGGLPQLVTPFLASTASEAVDSATLAFLLSQSLAAKKHEEQKKRQEEAKEVLKAWKVRRKRSRMSSWP